MSALLAVVDLVHSPLLIPATVWGLYSLSVRLDRLLWERRHRAEIKKRVAGE